MGIKWNGTVSQKFGQEPDKETGVIHDKENTWKLAISAEGEHEEMEHILTEISKIIAKTGGQTVLSEYFVSGEEVEA